MKISVLSILLENIYCMYKCVKGIFPLFTDR